MFVSSRNNQFRFNFPRTFIPKSISDKYKPYLNRMPGNMIKEPIDIFNYGIQSLSLPGPSFDPVQQNDLPGNTRRFRTSLPKQELFDKSMTVTMKSLDGYVNYWMAIELFEYYYNLSGKKPFLPDGVGIQMIDSDGNTYVTAKIQQMILSSVSSLDLNFSSNTTGFEAFDLGFSYNIIDININLV